MVHVYSSIDDFTITGLLGGNSQGSHGVIVNAVRKSDQKEFVMKFFGYTRNKPDISWIVREIDNLKTLTGIQGINNNDPYLLIWHKIYWFI